MGRTGFTTRNVLLKGEAQVVGASATNQVVSEPFAIRSTFLKGFRVDLTVSASTVATGITAKLQVRQSADQSWIDSKTAAITVDGNVPISLLSEIAGDQAFLPLRPMGRIVITSGAGDTVTVGAIYILESTIGG